LHQPFVYSINQDLEGFLWIGTGEGLYRFNGFDFEYFTTEEGLGDNFITKVYRNKAGSMWLGHQNGSVSVTSGNDFKVLNADSEASGAVSDITEDDRGFLWVAVQNQGLVLIDKAFATSPVDFSAAQESMSQIEYLGNEHFLLGTQDNLYLCRYERASASMVTLKRFEAYPGSRVVEIFPASRGNYIIVSQDEGFYSVEVDTLSSDYTLSSLDDNSDGVLDNLQGGLMDGRGTLWLNSMGNGLIKYRTDRGKAFIRSGLVSTVNGLVSDNVRSVFEDIEGNIWLGMYGGGLLRYVDNNLAFYSFNPGDGANRTYTLAGNENGLWFVIEDRLMRINPADGTVLNSYPLPVELASDRARAAYLGDDGRLWLGFEQAGLYVAESSGKGFRSVFLSNDNLANSVNHISGQDSYLWISTKKGVCRINTNTSDKKWFTTDNGLPHNNIQQLYPDSKGRVLVATLCREIYYISDKGEVAPLDNSRMEPFTHVVSILEDNSGSIWAGTQGNGIWRIVEGGNVNYTRASGLISDFCYSLTLTEDGMPVTGHRGGISRINPRTNRIKTLSRLEGVKSSAEFYPNAIYPDKLGNVWFGTSEGLVRYTSALSEGGRIPPMLTVNALYVNGEEIDLSGPVLLKAGQYELAVEYIGINFSNPEMVIYQTKLEGYNKNWSALGSTRRVVYDRVGHGEYEFRIRAFNENDIVSEISSAFLLKIRKPVYLAFWFYAAIVLLLGFAFYMILKWRERNLRTEQQRLLKNLDEKTKDIIVKEEIIKERKKVEQVLIEAKTKAELSEKLKTAFLQNMSHEIRTPMNAIVGFSDLLKNSEGIDTKQSEYIKIINTNAENLLSIIDDILDISQLETNQLKIKQGVCKLNTMISGLKLKYRDILNDNGKKEVELIAMSPGDTDMQILTDPIRLKQILIKLLDNAVKYTASGKITFGYKIDQNNITFFVEDTGIGLSEDKKEIVFDLFRKIVDVKVKMYGGTGLGLTLARYLVDLLGGEINVESKENIGSRFYFDLPYISGAELSVSVKESQEDEVYIGKWKGKRILIVEDTDSNFKLLKEMLSPTGIVVKRAKNGEEALNKYFREGYFNMIIMDILLPGMDGYEITRKIREHDKKVPIISYTAYALEGDRERSIEAGCNDYIAKPSSGISMLDKISEFL